MSHRGDRTAIAAGACVLLAVVFWLSAADWDTGSPARVSEPKPDEVESRTAAPAAPGSGTRSAYVGPPRVQPRSAPRFLSPADPMEGAQLDVHSIERPVDRGLIDEEQSGEAEDGRAADASATQAPPAPPEPQLPPMERIIDDPVRVRLPLGPCSAPALAARFARSVRVAWAPSTWQARAAAAISESRPRIQPTRSCSTA